MTRDEKLDWERRFALPAGIAALFAALLPLVGFALRTSAFANIPKGDRAALLAVDENAGTLVGTALIQTGGYLLAAFVLFYLFRAASHRTELPKGIQYVIIAAPLVAGIGLVWSQIAIADLASEFVDGARAEARADNLIENQDQVPAFLGLAGSLMVAFSFVFASLHAMRTGLLSRFMGILGIISGALIVLPLAPGLPSIVQMFWMFAVGLLFLGRWPGQRGPAWDTGESVPWPSAAQLAAERQAAQQADAEPETPATKPSRKRRRKR